METFWAGFSQSSPKLTQKQAAYHQSPQRHRRWGNAEGVRGLLMSQSHRQAHFFNVRAAQRTQLFFLDLALAVEGKFSGHLRREAMAGLRAISFSVIPPPLQEIMTK
nr:hypothetical protein [uncultured Devosia sp.]